MCADSLIGPKPQGLPVEAAVQFCEFCGETVYRTLLVLVGDGTVRKSSEDDSRQVKAAERYRKACPRCAEVFRARLREARFIEQMGRWVARMVAEGASQREIDEYVVGFGLDRELVRGFGIPEVERIK